ncbi:anaerobic ribonucleoside-triphosphate reductase activating protein [Thermoanaerobacterium thermosaccharolyticum]|uniref:anaerobic ribonucleoside-triphosphate reductase activating protein n=1 Tax=Thermoanaerobacterium thermosaccharolyticum TaxID=1517 RepID=UPI00177C9465|nr:anaerobic ribonucleoside-triphosphate reductase activating protein [Thermoanaerobacterium thermosaccharolyticum]MBE0069675.1 anaerobic ribonucleoside-triphosphate reductase activating protein [Thermoanaerobacterium thermosaccharolyticum]MBE0229373.1 anaerobic ribonucleoside-triphosphate reductase activating protein [Thermoanaerobacterium thermosaccharolyticum]
MIYDYMMVSLADYPGKVASTVFTSGCNFTCPYCHNSQLIDLQKSIKSEEEFIDYLKKRKNLIDGVCITGGEPTLWKDLKNFIKTIRDLGFSVKLDTNGSRPNVIEDLLNDNLLDYIAMDVKAPKNKYGLFVKNNEDIERIVKSIDLIKNSGIDYEFRTTVNEKLLSTDDFLSIANMISGCKRYVLQRYKYSEGVLNKDLCGKGQCDIEYLIKIKEAIKDEIEEILIR